MEGKTPNGGTPEIIIRFTCNFCGQRIRTPKTYAGKKGKCPKCGQVIFVPKPTVAAGDAASVKPDAQTSASSIDLLLNQPAQPRVASTQPEIPKDDGQFEMLRQSTGSFTLLPERNLPWLIDIFLYPANAQGMIFLAIAVFVPLLIQLIALFLCIFGLIFFIINGLIGMYIYWFLAQCVRDSASGGLRAPETIAETPGLGELFWQLLEIISSLVVCAAPAAVYFDFTRRFDTAFWFLAGVGAFLYPMTLLAVIMFGSMDGLNPFIVIPSIFSTFFQYCGLPIFIAAIIFLYIQTVHFLPRNLFIRMMLSPLLQAVELYLAMVAAHILGRFYFKYQKKLNWDV
jgi:hypothetical protein